MVSKKTPLSFDLQHLDDDEDAPKTLLKKLELSGNLKAHSEVQMQLCHRYYVKQGKTPKQITKLTAVHPKVVEKWALLFGWDEERDEYTHRLYRRAVGIAKKQGINVDARADRIMATIESLAEQMLHQHKKAMDTGTTEGLLKASDLTTLANCIKTTHGQRSITHGTSRKEENKKIDVVFSGGVDILHQLGMAAADLTGNLVEAKQARIAYKDDKEVVEDAEYEVLSDDL